MDDNDDVRKATSVELLELRLHPEELYGVVGDGRVERQHECVAVAEAIRRIAVQSTRRALRWNQARVGREIIAKTDENVAPKVIARPILS